MISKFLDSMRDVIIPASMLLMVVVPFTYMMLRTQPEYHDIYEITDEGVVIEYNGELHLYDDVVNDDAEYVSGYYWVWEERCPENYHIDGSYRYWIRRG